MSVKKPPSTLGRPATFNVRVRDTIINLAEKGWTEQQIADVIGVSLQALKNWKGANPDLVAALKEKKAAADGLVEASLFQRACGYSAPAVKVFYDAKTGKTVEHHYIERYPPDTAACIFWLKNRQPLKWRDTQRFEIGSQGPIALAYVPKSERQIKDKEKSSEPAPDALEEGPSNSDAD